jgi:hypothetical protein
MLEKLLPRDFKIGRDVRQNMGKRSYPERMVRRDSNVMLFAFLGGCKTEMATRLSRDLVSKAMQHASEFTTTDIARNLQAEMTSSFTR